MSRWSLIRGAWSHVYWIHPVHVHHEVEVVHVTDPTRCCAVTSQVFELHLFKVEGEQHVAYLPRGHAPSSNELEALRVALKADRQL